MFPFPSQKNTASTPSTLSRDMPEIRPHFSPWQTATDRPDEGQRRLDAMERNEPKRRLIRDAKALAKLRRVTQVQMAEEMGVPHRTLEEWLQFRRMPQAPGTTLIQRWMEAHRGDIW